MSDLNTEIKIGADASGVEAGVSRAKRSLKDLGESAKKAGQDAGAGIGAIGAGGDKAAKDVERATKNIQGQLQRAIASFDAGEKGSRKFYESLARQRGADVATLKPYLDQLDQVKAKTSAAKAASEDWMGSLRSINGLLAGLGAAVSIGGISAFVKQSIDAADSMSKLSQKSGVAVESLVELNYAASLSDVSTEGLATGLRKLSQNMAEAAKGSKEQAAAFAAVGVNVQNLDGSLKGADEVLKELATRFSNFKDGPEKAALAIELFGKQGAELIPLLNGGAAGLSEMADEARSLGVVFGADLAKNAETFNDNLTRIQASSQGAATAIAGQLLPTLNLLTQEFIAAKDGSQSFATSLGGGLRTVVESATILYANVSFVLQGIGREIGAIGAQFAAIGRGDFSGWTAISDAVKADGKRARAELDKFTFDLLNAGILTSKAGAGRGTAPDPRSLGDTSESAPIVRVAEKAANAAKEAQSAYDAMFKHFAEQRNAMVEELALGREQTVSEKERTKVITDLGQIEAKIRREGGADMPRKLAELETRKKQADGELLLNEALRQQLDVQRPLIKHAEELAKARQAYRQSEEGAIRGFLQEQDAATHAALQGVADRARSLDEENAALGLTQAKNISLAEAVERVTIARLKDQQASKFWEGSEGWKNLQAEIDAREKLAEKIGSSEAAKKELEAWRSTFQSIDSTAHDAFVSIFDQGSDVFKRLGDALKHGVLDLLYQLTVRQWIIQIGASIAGPGSVQGLMTGFNAPGGMLGGLGNLFGSGSTSALGSWIGGGMSSGNLLGSVYANTTGGGLDALLAYNGAFGTSQTVGAAAGTLADANFIGAAGGDALGSLIEANAAWEGVGTAATGAAEVVSGALASIPVYGWIAAAVLAIAGATAKGGTPHAGGASLANAQGLQSVKPNDIKLYFDDVDKTIQGVTDSMAKGAAQLLNTFGAAKGKLNWAVATGFARDGEDSPTGQLSITQNGHVVRDWESTRQDGMVGARDFVGDFKDYWAAFKEDFRAALGDLDIPGWAARVLEKATDPATFAAASDNIAATMAGIQQLVGVSANDIGTKFVDGLIAQDYAGTGKTIADTIMAGIERSMLTGFAEQVSQTAYNGILVPILGAVIQGADVAQAVAEANIQQVVERVTKQADAFAAVWNNAEVQKALGQTYDLLAKTFTTAAQSAQYTPKYIQSTQAAAAAQSDLAAAQSEATRAAEQEAQRLADLHKSLNGDLASLDIELLRRSGQSAAADAAARAKATEGYDAEALALYDLIAIRRAHIADLDAEAARVQQLDGLYAGIYAKIATPAERMAYGYERIAKNLQNAGLFAGQTDLSSILAKASMPQVRDTVQKLWGESSSQTRLALLDAVGGLADLKTEAASLADQAEQTALNLATQNANAALAIVQRAIDAEKKAGQERLRLAQTEETRLKSLVDYLHGQTLDLYGQSDSTAQWMAAQGQAYIDAALAGGALDRDKLGEAVSAIRATLKPDLFGSAKDMEFQTLVLAGKLGTLEQSTGRQLTAAQRSLKAEEDAAKALDDLAQTQRDALDIARGQYTGILGVQDAIKQLSAAILAEKAISGIMQGSIAGSTYAPKTDTLHSAVTGLDYSGASIGGYLKALNAAGDNAGALDAYQQLTANGATSAMVSKLTGWSLDQINTWVDANNLPRFAGGGWHDGGWAMVGEQGPELAYMPPARIYNAGDTAAMVRGDGGYAELVTEVRALRAEVIALRRQVDTTNDNTARAADAVRTPRQVVVVADLSAAQ